MRDAVTIANPGDRIIFAPVVRGEIRLTGGELLVNKPLSIVGPGAAQLAVSGSHNSRVFHFGPQGNVDIYGMTITEGRVVGATGGPAPEFGEPGLPGETACGGGILNEGSLSLFDCMAGRKRRDRRAGIRRGRAC